VAFFHLGEGSSFFEKKEAKKLLVRCRVVAGKIRDSARKSFLVLFCKKEHSF
jgi:hypothetical protein